MDPAATGASSLKRAKWPLLVLFHVLVAVLTWQQIVHGGGAYRADDFGRYFRIGSDAGTPYRTFAVEYPPGAVMLFRTLAGGGFGDFVRRMMLVNIAAQASITWLCFKGWGKRAAISYLALSAPLMPILYGRFDLVGVVFAALGTYLCLRRRTTGAGIAYVAGGLVKLWPAA
jgi:Glycosyltransferase family 87